SRPLFLALGAEVVPVDPSCVDPPVTATADVDEGGLHRRQHVLDAAQVDVADQRSVSVALDRGFDQDVIFPSHNLGEFFTLPDDHLAYHRFAPGEELRLNKDWHATPTCLATFAS